jgi:hypothetical protein
MFRYFPTTGRMDIYPWMRAAAIEAGLEPNRCALATLDSLGWRSEASADGAGRILRKQGVVLSDDDRVFSFSVITGGSGRWDLRDDRISDLQRVTLDDQTGWKEELEEAGRLLRGDVFFPPALFSIAYPSRDGKGPWGAMLIATTPDHIERTAFRRDGTMKRSSPSEKRLSASGTSHRVPEWIEDPYAFAAEQASREKPLAQFRCACCRYLTLMDRGAFETCPVCCWEDDGQDDPHADEPSGPNHLTLTEARKNFRSVGAMQAQHVPHVRAPTPDEL